MQMRTDENINLNSKYYVDKTRQKRLNVVYEFRIQSKKSHFFSKKNCAEQIKIN